MSLRDVFDVTLVVEDTIWQKLVGIFDVDELTDLHMSYFLSQVLRGSRKPCPHLLCWR